MEISKEQQELFYKLSVFEQQIQQLQQQLQIIEQNINDLNSLNFGLDDIEVSVGNEMLAPLGKGIFVKSKILSKELTVDVGNKTFVKKSVPETKKIINEQTEKLESIKQDVTNKIQEVDKELTETIREAQKIGKA